MPNRYGKTLKQAFKDFSESTLLGYTYSRDGKNPAKLKTDELKKMTTPKELDTEFKSNDFLHNPKPSVYYKHGHVTLQHGHHGNLGWSDGSDAWQWLFFGNVPESEYQDYETRKPTKKSPPKPYFAGDRRPLKLQFAAYLSTKYWSYSRTQGTRTDWSNQAYGGMYRPDSDRLVEVWLYKPWAQVFINPNPNPPADQLMETHPSRGHFYWLAKGDAMRGMLHTLVKEMTRRLQGALPTATNTPLH